MQSLFQLHLIGGTVIAINDHKSMFTGELLMPTLNLAELFRVFYRADPRQMVSYNVLQFSITRRQL